jgi:hypothetical protein
MVIFTATTVRRNVFASGIRATMVNVLKSSIKIKVRITVFRMIKMEITAETTHCCSKEK